MRDASASRFFLNLVASAISNRCSSAFDVNRSGLILTGFCVTESMATMVNRVAKTVFLPRTHNVSGVLSLSSGISSPHVSALMNTAG